MSRSGAFRDFALGLNSGYALGDKLRQRGEQAEVGAAANTAMVQEQMSGDDTLANFQNNYVPQEGGPATAQEYLLQNPEIMQGLGSRKAGFAVGDRSFADRGEAQNAARGLNMQAMAQVYAKQGKPEDAMRLEQMAGQQELQGLQLKGAQRQNKEADVMANYFDIGRQVHSGELSEEDGMRRLASLATNGVQDGKEFGVRRGEDGKYIASMRVGDQLVERPLGSFMDAFAATGKYMSAGMYDKALTREQQQAQFDETKKLQRETLGAQQGHWARQDARSAAVAADSAALRKLQVDALQRQADGQERVAGLEMGRAAYLDAHREGRLSKDELATALGYIDAEQRGLAAKGFKLHGEARDPKFVDVPDKDGNKIPHLWDGQRLVPAPVGGTGPGLVMEPPKGYVPASQRGKQKPADATAEDVGDISANDYALLARTIQQAQRGLGYNSKLFGDPSREVFDQQRGLEEQLRRVRGLQRVAQ